MERVFFSRDLLPECILPHLSIFEVIALFQSNTAFIKAYKRKFLLDKENSASHHMFVHRVQKALTMFYGEENMQALCALMDQGHVYLTGGFLLAIIQGENVLQCEDADFVTIVPDGYVSLRWRKRWNMEDILRPLKMCAAIRDDTARVYAGAFSVDTFTVNKRKMQVISLTKDIFGSTMDRNDIFDQYFEQFDFSFCANYYGRNRLVVTNGKAVREKHCDVWLWEKYGNDVRLPQEKFNVRMESAWQRICKYRTRGYFIRVRDTQCKGPESWRIKWSHFWRDKT